MPSCTFLPVGPAALFYIVSTLSSPFCSPVPMVASFKNCVLIKYGRDHKLLSNCVSCCWFSPAVPSQWWVSLGDGWALLKNSWLFGQCVGSSNRLPSALVAGDLPNLLCGGHSSNFVSDVAMLLLVSKWCTESRVGRTLADVGFLATILTKQDHHSVSFASCGLIPWWHHTLSGHSVKLALTILFRETGEKDHLAMCW